MNPFRGTFTAIITPFRGNEVDFTALEAHVERQIAGGVDGLVPCGTTGESPTLTAEEHRRVVQTVVKIANRRVKIVAGTGSNNTAHAIHLSKEAADLGADGLLVVAPYYNKPSQEGLFQHYAAIARAVKLPIMVYNIPGRCGIEISIDTIKRMHEAHPTISSVKHATGSVGGAADLAAICQIEILSGDDPITLPLMSLGAVGVVSVLSNLAPRSVKRLTQAALAGDWKTALDAHRKMHALGKALLSLDTNPMPIKTACAIRGWCAEEFRLPICPLSAENKAKLARLLEQHPLD